MTKKTLRANGLRNADRIDQRFSQFHEIVNEDVTVDDIMHPAFYRHHKNLRKYDKIRMSHPADHFDFDITVRAVVAGGVVVDYFDGRLPDGVDLTSLKAKIAAETAKLAVVDIAADGAPVVRIQYLPKTKYRLLGLNGEEVKRDIPSKEAAENELAIYLAQIRMRVPTEAEIAVELKRRADIADLKANTSLRMETKPVKAPA